MLDFYKELVFLELHNKIIRLTIYPMAQWKRIGFETAKSSMVVIDPHRHQIHFQCWIIYKESVFLESHNTIISFLSSSNG